MKGYIIVITRNGSLGGRYPLTSSECLFGQSQSCDIRVYVPNVARKHCLITALPHERAYIRNLSPSNTTLVNGIPIGATQYELQHADVITVGDRHFRWEYPFSSRPVTPARKIKGSGAEKSPACMVQLPMSVFTNKRHSSPGVVRENKIISISSQGGEEPNPKRRKTLHNITDLGVENNFVKPVNKRLLAVTQPASSPKSFNTFRVLLKSTSKRKSLIPVPKTPKSVKKVISSKVRRSKSLSPPRKLTSTQSTFAKNTKVILKRSPTGKSPKLSIPPLKSTKKSETPPSKPYRKSMIALKTKTPQKTPLKISPTEKIGLKRKSTLLTPLKTKMSYLITPDKSSRHSSSKKPLSISSTPKAPHSSSPEKQETPDNIPIGKFINTPQGSASKISTASVKSSTLNVSCSDSLTNTPGKTPRVRPVVTPQGSSPRKSPTLKDPYSNSPIKSPGKTPKGRHVNTTQHSPSEKSLSPAQTLTPKVSRNNSPVMTSGKSPVKTPQLSPLGKSLSPANSPKASHSNSPVKEFALSKTPRGRPVKTPQRSLSAKSQSPAKSPTRNTSHSNSPVKTPQRSPSGKSRSPTKSPAPKASCSNSPVKTPQRSPSAKSRSLAKSPTPKASRSNSPVKTQDKTPRGRGRPVKTPQRSLSAKSRSPAKSPTPKASLSNSPVKTPDKTPRGRGRPVKTPQRSPSGRSRSPAKSPTPKPSRSNSPVKKPSITPKGRPVKTPQSSKKSFSPVKSPSPNASLSNSPVKEVALGKTPRGRPVKTPQRSPSGISLSPAKSPTPKASRSNTPVKTPGKTPRGRSRPVKTPERSSGKSLSPAKSPTPKASRSNTPVKTPGKTPRGRGRPVKTPERSSGKSLSPAKSPTPKASRSNTPVKTPGKTPRGRGRPAKTPQRSPSGKSLSPAKSPTPKASRSNTPVKTPGKTPRGRGRPVKTPERSSGKSLSPAKSPTPKASRSNTPVKTPGKTPRGRGRPAKTPQRSPSGKSLSPAKSPTPKASRSNTHVKTPGKTPRGRDRPVKTPQRSPSGKSLSPAKSPTPKASFSNSPVKTPDNTPRSRGRPVKTPQSSSSGKSLSPAKSPTPKASFSNSPVNTPDKTPRSRGRPVKTPQSSSSGKSLSPAKSPTPKASFSNSPMKTPDKTPRGRGRPVKTPQSSLSIKSLSPVKSPKASFNNRSLEDEVPGKTFIAVAGKISKFKERKSFFEQISPRTTSSNNSLLNEAMTPAAKDLSIDQSSGAIFNMKSNNSCTQGSSNAKSARRSALRSGLSSFKDLKSSNKPLLLKSTSKKADIAKLQSHTKRKFDMAEARAERAAKRLKMETPKSLTKNKKAALLVCHSPKSQKRPLFSDVLKSHLSTIKRNQAAAAGNLVVPKKTVKQISFQQPLSLEVPKSFRFNSTGHVNSPESIIITKAKKETLAPKTRKGRKSDIHLGTRNSGNQNLEGVQELFKTPKSIISSLKNASSLKKSQNVRVRFSLQNDVQSPSGKRRSVMHTDEITYLGSPVIPPKRYIGTPRPVRFSESSLMHTSIIEESPLAHEIDTSHTSSTSSKRNSKTSLNVSSISDKTYDFSAYSPSSPTLQFSQISGVSSVFARKSIDFSDFSPVSETGVESPKRKRSISVLNDSPTHSSQSSSKRFSFASGNSFRSKSADEFQPSPDEFAVLSKSDILDKSNTSQLSHSSRKANNSIDTSGIFKFSPTSNSHISSPGSFSPMEVSKIPLPPSPKTISTSKRLASLSSSLTSVGTTDSVRSTRSRNNASLTGTPKSPVESPQNKRSKSQMLNLTDRSIVSSSDSPLTQNASSQHTTVNFSQISSGNNMPEVSKRVSSTPKVLPASHIHSPISSPISTTDKRSLRNQNLTSPHQNILRESSKSALAFEDEVFKTPTPTPGRKSRKGSTRMSASNSEILTPESQVPVAAVKPSTRKKHGNESYSSASDSISLPIFSVSRDVSERSIDQSLSQKMLDSRVSSEFDQPMTSRSTNSSSSSLEKSFNFSNSVSSSRRKRKSSGSTSIHSVDATTFDFTSAMTPKIPREMFVSPLNKSHDDLTDVIGVKRVLSPKGNSPVSSYVDVRGVKKLLKTPKAQDDLSDVTGVKRVLNPKGNSPVSSYIDVKGVKRLLKTPQQSCSPIANYASVEGIKELFKQSPAADYSNVVGVKRLYSTTVEPNYMNVKGVRRIFKETKAPNRPDVAGVEILFESPKKIVDEYNQPSTSKPIGMVPPMTRTVSDSASEEPLQQTPNENRVQLSSRQKRTLTFQVVNDEQQRPEVSADRPRKSRRKVVNLQAKPEEVLQNQFSEEGRKHEAHLSQNEIDNREKELESSRKSRRKGAQTDAKENQNKIARKEAEKVTVVERTEVRLIRKGRSRVQEVIQENRSGEIPAEPCVSNTQQPKSGVRENAVENIGKSHKASKGKKDKQEILSETEVPVPSDRRKTMRGRDKKPINQEDSDLEKHEILELSDVNNTRDKSQNYARKEPVKKNENENSEHMIGSKTRGKGKILKKQEDAAEILGKEESTLDPNIDSLCSPPKKVKRGRPTKTTLPSPNTLKVNDKLKENNTSQSLTKTKQHKNGSSVNTGTEVITEEIGQSKTLTRPKRGYKGVSTSLENIQDWSAAKFTSESKKEQTPIEVDTENEIRPLRSRRGKENQSLPDQSFDQPPLRSKSRSRKQNEDVEHNVPVQTMEKIDKISKQTVARGKGSQVTESETVINSAKSPVTKSVRSLRNTHKDENLEEKKGKGSKICKISSRRKKDSSNVAVEKNTITEEDNQESTLVKRHIAKPDEKLVEDIEDESSYTQAKSTRQEDHKATRRRVQFNMETSPKSKKSTQKALVKKTAAAVKTKASPKLKAAKQSSSMLKKDSQEKTVPAAKAEPKDTSPKSKKSTQKKVLVKKTAAAVKTKASPKLKAAKVNSPSSTLKECPLEQTVPAKKTRGTNKTEAPPKLKAASKKRISLESSLPAKRVTRSTRK